jgi:enoyl-CoA hydratase
MGRRELIARREGRLGWLSINRPAALGALTLGMCDAMLSALLEWRDDRRIATILIDHEGERGFCAGGDIRSLAQSGAGDGVAALQFFHTEYRLNHLLAVYPKPVVTVMDGIVMGGGVGISLPARYRIATERTRFAMPETGVGLFPDVGSGWHLPKLPGTAGAWIAYTGVRLAAPACMQLKIATHLVPGARLIAFKSELVSSHIDDVVAKFARDDWPDSEPVDRFVIDYHFGDLDLERTTEKLRASRSSWASEQLGTIATKSPLSLRVTERLLLQGASVATIAEDLRTEYRLASRLVRRHDFLEGVRSVIVERDNAPVWKPATMAEATDALVDEMFAPLPADQEWTPLPQIQGD